MMLGIFPPFRTTRPSLGRISRASVQFAFHGDFLRRAPIPHCQIRDRCEQWFQQIPEGKKADFCVAEIHRSTDDSAHDGAFFELFLHELFTVLGCGVDFQPSIGGKTPDFLLTQRRVLL